MVRFADLERVRRPEAALERTQPLDLVRVVEHLEDEGEQIDARAVDHDAELEAEPVRQRRVGLD